MALTVIRKDKETVDQMIRRFKNKFKESSITRDFFEKQYFIKPSQIRKERKRLALSRKQRSLKENF